MGDSMENSLELPILPCPAFLFNPNPAELTTERTTEKAGGVFEKEQPKVGPKGEMSGSERVKGHRG
jgi:hypothetical protein